MPFVGGDSPPPARSKRRWQDYDNDDDSNNIFALYSYNVDESCSFGGSHHPPFGLSARRMAAPTSKRTRLDHDDPADATSNITSSELTPRHRCRPSQQAQNKKTPQISSTSAYQHRPARSVVLAPCHICLRRPTKKSDLDSFAPCEGCCAQTCFVCIRQCHGRGDLASVLSEQSALSRSFCMEDADDGPAPADPDGRPPTEPPPELPTQAQTRQKQPEWAACGHRSVVCSRCCVEKGPEGEVVCLGCLLGDNAPEDIMTF
ncbi:hypothetical protein CCM_06202 [Cordyceps militaris CM01]|uniref:Uncharacterized protein n=1 Tax=Cordyceps militaris (strain CM01) TaxID=983644 RepID=G3JJA0_CORMM|nr:uncharacterized protein CCM_06202 [Cordyceps militaris CM01]EGX92042.1 hypothetical protein CCM_06202 [Cordyceps militaris CM01]